MTKKHNDPKPNQKGEGKNNSKKTKSANGDKVGEKKKQTPTRFPMSSFYGFLYDQARSTSKAISIIDVVS